MGSHQKSLPLVQTVFIATAMSFVVGTMLVLANFDPGSLTEGYQPPTLPSRDQLQRQLPSVPAIPTPDPATLRQSGASRLAGLNLDQVPDHNSLRNQMNALTNEVSHPDSNNPADPTGNNVATGQNSQSSVTSNGSLPSGSLAVEPKASGLGREVADRASRDALSSWYNALAATMSLRAEVVTKQTQKLADKFDEINNIHRDINTSWQDLNSTANAILMQLPTIPGV